ncbi:hypothetical protein ACIRPK_35950 [Kitasatospora sp. NPDC101801]|uniref:hypothetical protein n=1 Tax=Kitasatospora sp. NPDC101801 TaxID=3364103 RepID=UPI0038081400
MTADPALLGRWDCGLAWALAENDEPERFRHSAPNGTVRSLVLPAPVDGPRRSRPD